MELLLEGKEFMRIVIVGGGTAGWLAALIASSRFGDRHEITVVESTKIGIIGVGESTTGWLTEILTNQSWDYGCDLFDFILETGATIKYGTKHKGWTKNIEDYYYAPLDGSIDAFQSPDMMMAFGLGKLRDKEFISLTRYGYLIKNNKSTFNRGTNSFLNNPGALHVDAQLVGKYFKKISSKNQNVKHIDSEVKDVCLGENGFITHLNMADGTVIEGDFFIDCTGLAKVLMKKLPNEWVSYRDNLPVNTAMPFQLDYLKNEMPEPFTTAWAQSSGWMWQTPLMDRKGNGYVFDDHFITPDQAQEEIEVRLGRKIKPIKVIKFDAGRYESAWVKNCLAVGLSAAFLEPLEATSIHSTIVQCKNFFFEFLKPTLEETVNESSIKLYNKRTQRMYDTFRDFLVMHYTGGRDDSEFWKYINTGATQTDFIKDIIKTAEDRLPTADDFSNFYGTAGWPLWAFIMNGVGRLNKDKALKEIDFYIKDRGPLENITAQRYYELQDNWREVNRDNLYYDDFIRYFRKIREENKFNTQV